MLAFLLCSVFQKADIMLFLHRRTEYNGCSGSTLSNRLAHFSLSTSALACLEKKFLSAKRNNSERIYNARFAFVSRLFAHSICYLDKA